MTTLHGKEIKVGDKVWSVMEGWVTVKYISVYPNIEYKIEAGNRTYTKDGGHRKDDKYASLFWKEMILTPKPEPVYEYQWCFLNFHGYFEVTKGHLTKEQFEISWPSKEKPTEYFRIEQSKREVGSKE